MKQTLVIEDRIGQLYAICNAAGYPERLVSSNLYDF